MVRFPTLDGATREATLAMRDYWTLRAFKDRMVDEDFPLPDDAKEVKRLHDRLKRHAGRAATDPSRRFDATPLQGWHGDEAFVCGDRVLPEGAPVVFLAADGVTYPRVERRGTFAGWRDGVAALLPCSSRLTLDACGGLASALLRVWRGTLKGFGFNKSGKSRRGKSLGLRLVCSTIGPPDLEGWNQSRSGVAERLMGHRGLPLVLDDTADARPDGKGTASIVDQVTGLVALGRPDGLHHGSVGELQKAGVGFQSILLSTTEGALPPRRRGLQARLVEIPLPANGFGVIDYPELCQPPVRDDASAGRWVEAGDQAMRDHHGHAYPRFVRGLLKLGGALEAEVRALEEVFRAATPEADGDAWARSVRESFALAYAAGALACRFGIFPFAADVVLDRLRRCLLDALARADAPAVAAAAQAEADAEAIRRWLHAHWAGRVSIGNQPPDASAARRRGILTAKDGDGSWSCLVRKATLAEAVPDPTRLDAALRLIAGRGGLRPGDGDGNLTRQRRLADGTKARFLFFTITFGRPKTADRPQAPDARPGGKT